VPAFPWSPPGLWPDDRPEGALAWNTSGRTHGAIGKERKGEQRFLYSVPVLETLKLHTPRPRQHRLRGNEKLLLKDTKWGKGREDKGREGIENKETKVRTETNWEKISINQRTNSSISCPKMTDDLLERWLMNNSQRRKVK
jgi:hypothetical protein